MAYVEHTLTQQPSDGRYIYDVPFPFLSRGHVYVMLDDEEFGEEIEWVDEDTIEIMRETVIPLGTVIKILRSTPKDGLLVDFQDGQLLDQTDLNTSYKQILYSMQEIVSDLSSSSSMNIMPPVVNQADILGKVEGMLTTDHLTQETVDLMDNASTAWEDIQNTPSYSQNNGFTFLQPGGILLYGGDTLDNIDADNVPESDSKKYAAESGADVTGNNTSNDVETSSLRFYEGTTEKWNEGTVNNLTTNNDQLKIEVI